LIASPDFHTGDSSSGGNEPLPDATQASRSKSASAFHARELSEARGAMPDRDRLAWRPAADLEAEPASAPQFEFEPSFRLNAEGGGGAYLIVGTGSYAGLADMYIIPDPNGAIEHRAKGVPLPDANTRCRS
jgi:hypothetical protein